MKKLTEKQGEVFMNKSKIFAVVLAITVIMAVGCAKGDVTENNIVYYNPSDYSQSPEGIDNSGGNDNEEESVENIPTVTANPEGQAGIAGLDIKFVKVYGIGTLKADDYYPYDRQMIAPVFEITNNTDGEIEINGFDMDIKILDGDQTSCVMDATAIMYAQEKITDIERLDNVIKPGETVVGYIPYSVFSRWESLTVFCNPYYLNSEETIVFDITKDMVEDL